MIRKLLSHEWKALRRSSFWTQSVVQAVFLGLFALYFILMALGLGFGAGFIIEESYPNRNVVEIFTGFFVLYLLTDLIMRFLLQKFPSVALNKYLTHNIKKDTLAHYVILKSIPQFFNILPLFAVIPFFLTHVISNLTGLQAGQWITTIILLIFINNFLSYMLDRLFGKQPIISIILLGLISSLIFLDFNGTFPIKEYLFSFYKTGFLNPIFLLSVVLALIVIYYSLFKLLRKNAYLETGASDEGEIRSAQSFTIFNHFGDIGKWMQLEAKLIWRNKRPKSYLWMSFLFLLYPFIIGIDSFNSRGLMILIGLFMTGAFALNYGQLLLSWNSSHFDLILTQNFPLKKYLKAKYYLLAFSCFVFGILTLPYGIININFLLIILTMCLFNIGVTIPIYIFLAVHASKKIDLTKGGMFNYEGFGAAHYMVMLPIMAVPLIIYAICRAFDQASLGISILAIIGIIGIVFHDYILEKAIESFHRKKYTLQNNLSQ